MNSKILLIPALLLAPVIAWSAPANTAQPASAPVSVSHDAALYGNPARADYVTRTVDIAPTTHYVRVASGESVSIRVGTQTVNWTFLEAINGSTLNLALLMPDVPQARGVYVHVEPSEIYRAG